MRAQYDTSMAVGGAQRNEISTINDRGYPPARAQNEVDEGGASKARQMLTKTAKFIFSHIGLVGLVGIYAVAGGFLFELLERHQDMVNCQEALGEQTVQLNNLKQRIVAYIQYNTTASTTTNSYSLAKDNTTVAYANIGSMLYDFRDFVVNITSTYRFAGDDCSLVNKWTYPNSLLFAITIITTIGYGNIT